MSDLFAELSDQEWADLAERTQRIVELTEQPGWELFLDRAGVEIGKHQEAVLGGHLDEHEYRRKTGFIEGALTMLRLPNRVKAELEERALEREEARQARQEDEEQTG